MDGRLKMEHFRMPPFFSLFHKLKTYSFTVFSLYEKKGYKFADIVKTGFIWWNQTTLHTAGQVSTMLFLL